MAPGLLKRFDSLKGATQPDPSVGENYRARMPMGSPPLEFEIPADWLSGVYLGKLTAREKRTTELCHLHCSR